MKLVDANVLIYAVNRDAAQHQLATTWLRDELSSGRRVAIPSVSWLAFLRITTHPKLLAQPLTLDRAGALVSYWLALPNVVDPIVDDEHAHRVIALLKSSGTGGNLVNDAHLATLALHTGSPVVTFDRDFERFGVSIEIPGS